MYLVSYSEERGFIEASLGGRLTPAEVAVFGEELLDVVDGLEGKPYQMLLDYSKARGLNADTFFQLGEIRDRCHELGAAKIVSVTASELELETETAFRLEAVMDGREEFVLDPSYARFASIAPPAAMYRAA